MSLSGDLDATVTDDMVEFTFTVRNDGDADVDLTFSDACKADFAVEGGGQEHWRWSEGRMFTQMIESDTIPAGGTTTYEAAWTTPVSGNYDAVATLEANDVDVVARESFSVQ